MGNLDLINKHFPDGDDGEGPAPSWLAACNMAGGGGCHRFWRFALSGLRAGVATMANCQL